MPRIHALLVACLIGFLFLSSAWAEETPPTVEVVLPADGKRESLDAIAALLDEATSDPAQRDADGTSKVRLVIRADEETPWVECLWVMMLAAGESVRIGDVLFAVAGPGKQAYLHRLPRASGIRSALKRKQVRVDLDGKRAHAEVLAEVSQHAEEDTRLVVDLGLAATRQHAVTTGYALPLLAALEAAGHDVRLRAVPLGRVGPGAGVERPDPLPSKRAVFGGTRLWEETGRRDQRRNASIMEALKWLAAHQEEDGRWKAGRPEYDVGVTGLALLAFLGAGYVDKGKHIYEDTLVKGVRYLKRNQDEDGCFGARDKPHFIYNHGAATWAMIEVMGMRGSRVHHASAQRALDFIAMARNPYFAWRYGVKPGDNDTSVTTWMVTCIAAARMVNAAADGQDVPFVVDEEAYDGARAWIEKMTDPDYGRIGYIQRGGSPARQQELIDKFPGDKSEAMTAAGVTCLAFIGAGVPGNRRLARSVKLMAQLPPVWNPADGSIDMYYWFWGTMAMHQVGGAAWKRWWPALQKTLTDNQRKDTTADVYRGSWGPVGPWGREGGRVYATALCCLALETPCRYGRVGKR